MKNQLARLMLAGLVVSTSVFAEAETAPDWNAETLSGDWGGARSSLYGKGITVELTHKSDMMSVVSGGIKHGSAWMGNTEAGIQMDLDKLLGWEAATAYIHIHSQLGGKFDRDHVGSFIGSGH